MCDPGLSVTLAVIGCMWISKHSVVHNLTCVDKLYSNPTWPWCMVPPDHRPMVTLPASFFSSLTIVVILELPLTCLASMIPPWCYFWITEKVKLNTVMLW